MTIHRGINPKKYLELIHQDQKLDFIIQLAALAPSSHNMQPWFFQKQGLTINVLPNHHRRLVVADPDGREFYITLGALIQNLKVVCDSYGLQYEIKLGNFKDQIASLTILNLQSSGSIDYLSLEALIARHNSRLPFLNKSLPFEFLQKLPLLTKDNVKLILIQDSVTKEKIRHLILESVRIAFRSKSFRRELAPWLKTSVGHHEDGLVGRNLGMPFLVSLFFPTMTKYFDTSKLQVKIFERMLNNVPVHAVLCTLQNTPLDWLNVGQSFEAISIESQKHGISVGVMQAAIEDKLYHPQLQKIINSGIPQMFFRLGYTDRVHKHSPRLSLKKILK